MSHPPKVAQAEDFPWQSADTLPEHGFVLARITHCENSRREKLVFAKAQEDGVCLADGSELSFDWSVTGWVNQNIEIDLRPVSAHQAKVSKLDWQEISPGQWFAPDGLGGEYSYQESKRAVRFEADASVLLPSGDDPRKTAQEHHDSRIKIRLTD